MCSRVLQRARVWCVRALLQLHQNDACMHVHICMYTYATASVTRSFTERAMRVSNVYVYACMTVKVRSCARRIFPFPCNSMSIPFMLASSPYDGFPRLLRYMVAMRYVDY